MTSNSHSRPGRAGPAGTRLAPVLAAFLALLLPRRVAAENRIEYRFEDYIEDGDRVRVRTHGLWFEAEAHPKVALRGNFIYDAISGASPTGGPPAAGDPQVPVQHFHDEVRTAGSLEAAIRAGRTTTTPQISYSNESDYHSAGFALTEAIDFNQRNTTLVLGASRNFDQAKGIFQNTYTHKNNTDFLVGVNQLLGPNTTVTANLTIGYADGYLSDPYKGVNFFFAYPNAAYNPAEVDVNSEEKRPGHRFKQVGYLGLTHFFPRVQGAADVNYRLHHDDWGIVAHTATLQWNQKAGKHVTISPLFRYHRQSAADFYAVRFAGDPFYGDGIQGALQSDGSTILFSDDPSFPGDGTAFSVPGRPRYYSSDYRLSELETFTMGVGVKLKITDHLALDLAYKRYIMQGLDGVTPASAYPKASAYTIGLSATF